MNDSSEKIVINVEGYAYLHKLIPIESEKLLLVMSAREDFTKMRGKPCPSGRE